MYSACRLAPFVRVANFRGLIRLRVSAFDLQAPGVALQRVIKQTAAKNCVFNFPFPFSVRLNKVVKNLPYSIEIFNT